MRRLCSRMSRMRLRAVMLVAALLPTVVSACGGTGSDRPSAPPSSPPSMSPIPTPTPTPSPTPPASPDASPVPTASPTPLPLGSFPATVAVRPGAVIRSGPGTDMALVGQEPFGTVDLFDGWFRRGDDPPVPDFETGALETWSQDWYHLADGRGWIHSAHVRGFEPPGMAQVVWAPPPVRDVAVPPSGTHRIIISLDRQHLWAFDGAELVHETVIGTGRPGLDTPQGKYHILSATAPFRMVSPWPYGSPYWYASVWVEHTLGFAPGGYFIHDASWRTRWGPGADVAAGSHGCVNVPQAVMAQLYGWAAIGDEVVVQAG